MRNRSSTSRRSALLTLLFHLLVVGLGPLADARLELIDEAQATIHIEAETEEPCWPRQHHDDCQICRTLQSFDTPGDAGASVPMLFVEERVPAGVPHFVPPSAPRLSGLGPRAPPLA